MTEHSSRTGAEVASGFSEAPGIEIVRGRNFSEADRPNTQPVVIISDGPGLREEGDPVGRLVRPRGVDDTLWRALGVASNAKRTLRETPGNMVNLPNS